MKKIFKIFFTAQDPGGFNAISPVIKKLKKEKNFQLKIILANQAKDFAKKAGINYLNGNKLTDKDLMRLVEKETPDLIFGATSAGSGAIEKRLIEVGRAQKIKTASLIDFWSNYKMRFGVRPDYILVIDEVMRKEMAKQGFRPSKLIVVGSPFFDTFSKLTKLRQSEKIVSFFSEPFSENFKKGKAGFMGFNEVRVFSDLVDALERLQTKLPIVIKFHPKEKRINKFNEIIRQAKLDISIEKKLSAEDLIKKSKLVIGMNTIVLFQAALIGKKALSYQPDLNCSDPLISNRLGLSCPVYKKKDLYPALKRLLDGKRRKFSKKNLKIIEKYTKNNSTQKVIDFILKWLREN